MKYIDIRHISSNIIAVVDQASSLSANEKNNWFQGLGSRYITPLKMSSESHF